MIHRHAGRGARRTASGQSIVEFLIVVPVVLFLILGVVQMVLLYRAKAALDYAALEAARAGAVHGAKLSAIRGGLANGLMPLYARGTGLADLEAARARALLDTGLWARVEIVSPTRAAWNDHRERRYDGRYALPNDNLAFRSTAVGARSGVNVQDANVLKIRVVYRYPLVVPFVREVLKGASWLIRPANLADRADMQLLLAGDRLPIESFAIVRMQSSIDSNAATGLPR